MKIMNLRDLKESAIFVNSVKMIPAICLLFYIGTGMSNSLLSEAGTLNGTEETLYAEETTELVESTRTHANNAYVLAGETETGIIIIGGGIMLMSNRKSPNKLKKKNNEK